ncbi:MAG: ribosome rescue protein RqcH [Candidatus Bathyarchaeia archaeon]
MLKKEFTSFDVAATVRELREHILGSHVNNVYQLDPKTLTLKLHKVDHPPFQLVLKAGRRLHLTAYSLEKPPRPTAFCMALRGYLRNARLVSVEQYEFERVVILSLKTSGGVLRMVLEFFGNGNVILVGEDNKILQALTYKRMRDRNILRGEAFQFAPSGGKNPLRISLEELSGGLKASGNVEVIRALARLLGIGGEYSEEALVRASIEKTRSCDGLSLDEVAAIYGSLQGLLQQVTTGTLEPCVVLGEDGGLVDVVPFKLRLYEREDVQLQSYKSFNEALDEFYTRVSAVEEATAGIEVDKLKNEAERLKRMIAEQEKLLTEGEAKTELDKRTGDTVYAHIRELQALFDELLTGRQSGEDLKAVVARVCAEKQKGLMPSAIFESIDNRGLTVTVSVDGLRFELHPHKTLFENASEFYERAKQTKQKMKGARNALEDSCKQLASVEAKIRDAEALEHGKPAEALEELTRRKIKPKKWFEKFRWFVSSDGFLVVAGKDAVTNEVLVKNHSSDGDVVFHADIVGAPFVVVKTETKEPNQQCLSEAAEFAAAFSRAWREGFGSVDVYWVKPEQLSKGGPSGESVGHGAFVVRGQRNWMRGVKLELAVGILVDANDALQFVGGPIGAVKAKTEAYVKIVPGDLPGKELLKLVLKVLASKIPRKLQEKIVKASIEELREYIPFNKGGISHD